MRKQKRCQTAVFMEMQKTSELNVDSRTIRRLLKQVNRKGSRAEKAPATQK